MFLDKCNLDAVCLKETKLRDHLTSEVFNLVNFSVFRKEIENQGVPGGCLFVLLEFNL